MAYDSIGIEARVQQYAYGYCVKTAAGLLLL